MKSDFTDGEWITKRIGDIISIETKSTNICDVFFAWNPESKANARLISCAPEMIKALIEQNIRIEKICKYVKNEITGLLSDIFFENIDIIEKATGKKWEDIWNCMS
jgi:hypothetical protein